MDKKKKPLAETENNFLNASQLNDDSKEVNESELTQPTPLQDESKKRWWHWSKQGALGKQKNSGYFLTLITYDKNKKLPLSERIIKFLILIALRIVIRPSKWRDPKRNYDLIDRTYERIVSSDFIYIPSSIAFYIIMAFMPIISLIMFVTSQDFMHDLIYVNGQNAIASVLGDFIPGMSDLIKQVQSGIGHSQGVARWGANIAIILSLIVSAWIAAGGFSKLIFTLSHIYGHKFVGGYWMNKLRGFWMVFAFTLYLLIALIINIVFERFIVNTDLAQGLKSFIRYTFLIVGLFFLIFFGFIVFYRFGPRFKTIVRWIIPGAMTTTLPIMLFLTLFGLISSLWSYKEFGAIGAIMYLAMASLIMTYFIFVGIIVNASYHRTFVGDIEKKWTFSKK